MGFYANELQTAQTTLHISNTTDEIHILNTKVLMHNTWRDFVFIHTKTQKTTFFIFLIFLHFADLFYFSTFIISHKNSYQNPVKKNKKTSNCSRQMGWGSV